MKKVAGRLKCLFFVFVSFVVMGSGTANAQIDSLSVTDKNGRQVLLYKQSHALVIWAGDYQHQHWNKLTNIQSEVSDVVAALRRQNFTVTTVANPTGHQLRQAIQEFIGNYGYIVESRLVIYFAGHGATRKKSKGYLVPVDAPDPALNQKSEQEFLKVALDMEQVESWAKQIEAKHVLFVFDSCFSGTIFKQRSASTPSLYIEAIMNKPVRQFLTAGDAEQTVPAKSVFSPLFIRALQGEADLTKDGYVTGSELGVYIKQNLSEYTTNQTPQFGTIRDPGLDQGDIIFRVTQAQPLAAISSLRISSASAPLENSKPISKPISNSEQGLIGLAKRERDQALHSEPTDVSELITKDSNSLDPRTASSLANLASLYEAQGRYADAEVIWRKVLLIRAKVFGESHPDYAETLQAIATLYLQTGRLDEAEAMQLKAVKALESAFGKEHPRTASSINSLAGIYLRLANYKKAAPLIERALRIRSASLGPNHPDLVPILHNLLLVYQKSGDLQNAERVRTQINSQKLPSINPTSHLEGSGVQKYRNSPSGLVLEQGDIR
jgi:tetratricopeptide (TPR) repeat protein